MQLISITLRTNISCMKIASIFRTSQLHFFSIISGMHQLQCASWPLVTHSGILLAPCDPIRFVILLLTLSLWILLLRWIFGAREVSWKMVISIGGAIFTSGGITRSYRCMCPFIKMLFSLILTHARSRPNLSNFAAGHMAPQIFLMLQLDCFPSGETFLFLQD